MGIDLIEKIMKEREELNVELEYETVSDPAAEEKQRKSMQCMVELKRSWEAAEINPAEEDSADSKRLSV